MVSDSHSKKQNIPEHRRDFGKKVSIATEIIILEI